MSSIQSASIANSVQDNKPPVLNESKYIQYGSPTAAFKASKGFFSGVANAVVEAVANIFKAIANAAIWVKNLFQRPESSPAKPEASPEQPKTPEAPKAEETAQPATPANPAQPWYKNGRTVGKVAGAIALTAVASALVYKYFTGGSSYSGNYGGYNGYNGYNGEPGPTDPVDPNPPCFPKGNNPFVPKCFQNGLDRDFASFITTPPPPKPLTLDQVLKGGLNDIASAKNIRQARLDRLAAQNQALCKSLGVC